MGKKFIADGAPCMCKFGTAPGRLKVISHQIMVINHSQKKIATSMELGSPFYPPMFAVCRANWPPRPCSPAVIKWDNYYKGMRNNLLSNPLLPESKATCSVGGSQCIEIIHHGQFEMLGFPHLQSATAEHCADLDPVGSLSEVDKIEITVQQI